MKPLSHIICSTLLLPAIVSADDNRPVETVINTISSGSALSFTYDKPIFKDVGGSEGYSLVPKINFRPPFRKSVLGELKDNPYNGDFRFVLKPKFSTFGSPDRFSSFIDGLNTQGNSYSGLGIEARTGVGVFELAGSYEVSGKGGFYGSLMYTNLIDTPSGLRFYPEIGIDYWSKNHSAYYYGMRLNDRVSGSSADSHQNFFIGYSTVYPVSKHWGISQSVRKTWFSDESLDIGVESDLMTTFGIQIDF